MTSCGVRQCCLPVFAAVFIDGKDLYGRGPLHIPAADISTDLIEKISFGTNGDISPETIAAICITKVDDFHRPGALIGDSGINIKGHLGVMSLPDPGLPACGRFSEQTLLFKTAIDNGQVCAHSGNGKNEEHCPNEQKEQAHLEKIVTSHGQDHHSLLPG